MAFDLIQSEYGWTDDQVLDLTLDRVSQCVRAITKRLTRNYLSNAHLLEAAVKNIAMFLAQSEAAAEIVHKIKLVNDPADEEEVETRPPALAPGNPAPPKEIVAPQPPTAETEHKLARDFITEGYTIEAPVDELPEDEGRKVKPRVKEEDMNPAGTFEKLLRGPLGNLGSKPDG